MALKRASYYSNDVTVIACTLYPIGLNVCVDYSVYLRLCYRSERSNSVFIFITFGMSSELRVCSKYLFLGAWVLFLEQTNTIISCQNSKVVIYHLN